MAVRMLSHSRCSLKEDPLHQSLLTCLDQARSLSTSAQKINIRRCRAGKNGDIFCDRFSVVCHLIYTARLLLNTLLEEGLPLPHTDQKKSARRRSVK